jgi:hypothetical protein
MEHITVWLLQQFVDWQVCAWPGSKSPEFVLSDVIVNTHLSQLTANGKNQQ